MTQRRKKWTISLSAWYPVAMYLGAFLVCMALPQLPEQTWLLPERVGSRALLMLWVVLLLGIDLLLDRIYLKCLKKDLAERAAGVKHGGLNVQTHQALSAMGMFLLDAIAVLHMVVSFNQAGAVRLAGQAVTFRSLALAAGIILWIYGRLLPRIPFQSIWGIRTKASMVDVPSWGRIHLKAVWPVCLGGALALVCGTLLPAGQALVGAALSCALAFGAMSLLK